MEDSEKLLPIPSPPGRRQHGYPYTSPRSLSRRRPILVCLAACALAFYILSHLHLRINHRHYIPTTNSLVPPEQSLTAPFSSSAAHDHVAVLAPGPPSSSTARKVPLEAHIMSKCPDARDCLQKLIVPAMERVNAEVDFRLSFIGSYSNTTDEVTCKHGPTECLGNMILLCAANLYPQPIIHLGFANCLISNYTQIPKEDFVKDCALEHGIDFRRLNDCLSDERGGIDLMRASFQRSIDASVKYSCTVRLDEKVWCIRDGGQWKECKGGSGVDDLVADVDALYKR